MEQAYLQLQETGGINLGEREIKLKVEELSSVIAKSIAKGKDVELRRSANGVSVAEISKRVVAR